MGGQAWQDATLFEAIALSKGAHSKRGVPSACLIKHYAAKDVRRIWYLQNKCAKFVESRFFSGTWLETSQTSNGFINGDAANANHGWMGERWIYPLAGKKAVIWLPFVTLHQAQAVHSRFNIDSLAMFKVDGKEKQAARKTLLVWFLNLNSKKTFKLEQGVLFYTFEHVSVRSFDALCAVFNGCLP